jgi:hypothetical protein
MYIITILLYISCRLRGVRRNANSQRRPPTCIAHSTCQKEKKGHSFLKKNAKARCGNPTVLSSNDKPRLSAKAMARRRTETFDAAAEINGATTENPLATTENPLATTENPWGNHRKSQKKCPQEVLVKFMSTSKKFKNNVFF